MIFLTRTSQPPLPMTTSTSLTSASRREDALLQTLTTITLHSFATISVPIEHSSTFPISTVMIAKSVAFNAPTRPAAQHAAQTASGLFHQDNVFASLGMWMQEITSARPVSMDALVAQRVNAPLAIRLQGMAGRLMPMGHVCVTQPVFPSTKSAACVVQCC